MILINYQDIENIISQTLSTNATEIARLYIQQNPEILKQYNFDNIRRKISWFLEYKKNPSLPNKTRPESMVLLISDVHFGRKTYVSNKPNEIDYNVEKAKYRLNNISRAVKKIYNVISYSYDIDSLNIFILGDIIDGELTFPAQQINLDIPEFKQITDCADTFGNMFDDLENVFSTINIRAVAGNHSHNPKTHNYNRGDNLLYEILKREYKRSQKINFNYAVDFYDIYKVKNTSFLLYHGYSIRSYLNMPFYGIYNWGARRIKTFPQDWDILLMGHFHTYSILSFPVFTCFLNGTLVSNDEHSIHYFGKDGDRMFHLFGIHPERGVTFRYALYAD